MGCATWKVVAVKATLYRCWLPIFWQVQDLLQRTKARLSKRRLACPPRTYKLRLIALKKFAVENGDDAVLFGETKGLF